MANNCINAITATVTDCEWREISAALSNKQMEWPASLDGTTCSNKVIRCETKRGPIPWDEGYMTVLSRSYPSVVFHYETEMEGGWGSPSTWFCNGQEGNKRETESLRKQTLQAEVERFISETPFAAEGVTHRVEIMPDGRVAADGENRFGECNIFSWANVQQISCGNWHTVGLTRDGTVIACGSNANEQCDVSDLPEPALAVSCGRYHTAILLQSGRVIVKGTLVQNKQSTQAEKASWDHYFPIYGISLGIKKTMEDWEKMNERIEHISVGEELRLKKTSKNGVPFIEVFNTRAEKIGNLLYFTPDLPKLLDKIKATVETVIPLSKKRKGSSFASVTIKLDYDKNRNDSRKTNSKQPGQYEQTKITSWPAVTKIKSIYDAVIGVTNDGELYVDGFCPCCEADLYKIMGLTYHVKRRSNRDGDSKYQQKPDNDQFGDEEKPKKNGEKTFHGKARVESKINNKTSSEDELLQNDPEERSSDEKVLSAKLTLSIINKEPVMIELTGTQYEGRTQRIEHIRQDDWVDIVRETDNPYSSLAIVVRNQEGSLGYVPQVVANVLAPMIDRGVFEDKGRVAAVTPLSQRSNGSRTALLSVWLYPKGLSFSLPYPVPEKKVEKDPYPVLEKKAEKDDTDKEQAQVSNEGLDENSFPDELYEIELTNTEMPDRIERIEHVKVGDRVHLTLEKTKSKGQIIVSSDEGPLGSINGKYFYAQIEADRYERVGKISHVTPLSKKTSRQKRPLIRVILYPKGWDMSKSIEDDLK